MAIVLPTLSCVAFWLLPRSTVYTVSRTPARLSIVRAQKTPRSASVLKISYRIVCNPKWSASGMVLPIVPTSIYIRLVCHVVLYLRDSAVMKMSVFMVVHILIKAITHPYKTPCMSA